MKQTNTQTAGNTIKKVLGLQSGNNVNPANNGNTNGSVNKKISLIQERIKNTVQLSFEKAVAHHENPAQCPLSTDGKSIERAFYNLIEALPHLKRNRIINKINETLKASSSERSAMYKDLANVNFSSAVPVAEQVKSITFPQELRFTESEANEINASFKANAEKPSKTALQSISGKVQNNKAQPRQATGTANKVSFIIDDITCINPDDILKDEISLAGFVIDSQGNNTDIDTFFVDKFKKGQTVTLNRKLADLDIKGQFPESFSIGLFLIESDLISNIELIGKLRDVLTAVFVTLGAAFFAAALLSLTPLAIALGIAAMGLIVTKYVITLMGDDISFISSDSLTLADKINPGDTFDRLIKIGKGFNLLESFDGEYNITAKWVGEL